MIITSTNTLFIIIKNKQIILMIINDNKQRSVEIEKIQFINKSLWRQFNHFKHKNMCLFLFILVFFSLLSFSSHVSHYKYIL